MSHLLISSNIWRENESLYFSQLQSFGFSFRKKQFPLVSQRSSSSMYLIFNYLRKNLSIFFQLRKFAIGIDTFR